MIRRLLWDPILAWALLLGSLTASEEPAFLAPPTPLPAQLTVPREVLAVVQAAEAAHDPAKAIAVLAGYGGAPHAAIPLLIGENELAIARSASSAADRAAHLAAAAKAFSQARSLDPNLRQASLGLAQVQADEDDWSAAIATAGPAIDPAVARQLLFYAQAACRAGDWELAGAAVDQGMLRFPTDPGFREVHLALVMRSGRFDAAADALLAHLARASGDGAAWRNLAYVEQQRGDAERELGAMEAATIAQPADEDLRLRLAQLQAAHGMAPAALATVRTLLKQPLAATPPATLALAARLAADCGELASARAWLDAVPARQRTRDTQLLAARLALDAQDPAAAQAALEALIALGEADSGVLSWAGSIAASRGDQGKAEAFYQQAIAGAGSESETALLRLAVLYLRENRLEDAATQIAVYLAKHPADPQAKQLMALVEGRRRAAAAAAPAR